MRKFTGILASAMALALALSGCSQGATTAPTTGATGAPAAPVTLRFTWWGNEVRNKMTNDVIAAFQAKNPNIKISAEPGEWSGYWDKLSTQVAGGDAPDIIQMDEQYLREFGNRKILLDLSTQTIRTDQFEQSSVDTGKINGKLYALPAGVNALAIVVNPKVFEAAGVAIPDDKTWTWDAYEKVAAEVTSKSPKGTYGSANVINDSAFRAFLFQRGKAIFTDTGLGFDEADTQAWFEMLASHQKAGAVPSPAEMAEDLNKAFELSMFGTGKIGMQILWSNQINALQKAAGTELKLLRLPSLDGTAKGANLWYKSGQYLSIASTSKHPKEAAAFVDYFLNEEAAAKILLAERGMPPNTSMVKVVTPLLGAADQHAAAYMTAIKPELRSAPVPPPLGISSFQKVMERYTQDLMFGRADAATAAKGFYAELKGMIKS